MPPQFVSALQQANVPLSAVSILITPLGTETTAKPSSLKPRLSHRANAEMNPASVMKLVTTSAGLSILGPDFTWRNRIWG
jgi:D-alanyl-D-alanine carboxypeptidase/D-alanyl-D-alanine-endopeptidase (penicillin-binding protein 4)